MAKFKIIISDPKTGTSKTVELEKNKAIPLIGRKLGDILDGTIVNLTKSRVQITGGSDKDGFPIRPGFHGGARRKVLVRGGVGFKPQKKGLRKRRTIRGEVITEEVVQINMKLIEKEKNKEK